MNPHRVGCISILTVEHFSEPIHFILYHLLLYLRTLATSVRDNTFFFFFSTAVQHERTPRQSQQHENLPAIMFNMYNNKPPKRKHSESLRSLESVKIKTKKELPDHSPSSSEGPTDSSLSPYTSSPISMKEIVYESSMRVLYVSIQWVKHIPTFKDLPYNDQNLLINQGWCEVFIIGRTLL